MDTLQNHQDDGPLEVTNDKVNEKEETYRDNEGNECDESELQGDEMEATLCKETEGIIDTSDDYSENNVTDGVVKYLQTSSIVDGNPTGSSEIINEKDVNTETASKKDFCPFVCGICSDKFDKVPAFYAHLKTHGNFDVISEMNKKNEMLEALNVKDKVDENIFKCGICQVVFPSMSLLHEHMVNEENMSDYNYSNAEHTARPNSIKGILDIKPEVCVNVAASPGVGRLGRGKRKRKVDETVTSESPTNKLSAEVEDSVSNVPKKKRMTKKRISENMEKEQDPVSAGTGKEGDLTPVIRSSRRVSGRGSQKRVDYKALAGLGSPKINSNVDKKSVRKHNNVTSSNKDVKEKVNEVNDDNDTDVDDSEKKEESLPSRSKITVNVDKNITEIDEEVKIVHSKTKVISNNYVKVVSMKIVKDKDKKTIKESLKHTKENKECQDSSDKDPDNLQRETILKGSENETKEVKKELNKDSDKEELAVKADGTFIDANSESDMMCEIELNYDYTKNASDDDSDDDFKDEEDYLDDDVKDPNFVPELDSQNNDGNDDIGSLINTKNPEEYLKKLKVKKKRITRVKNGGQLLSNCLYPCAICGRYYLWKALKKHMYAHVKMKLVECTECGKKYKSARHLKDHIRSVHAMKKFRCPKCDSILKGNQSFDKHVTMHILRKEITEALDEVEKVEVTEEEYIQWKAQQELMMGESYYKKKKEKQQLIESEKQNQQNSIERSIDIGLLENGPLHGEHIVLKADIVGTTRNLFCKICQRTFPTHESLVQHMLEHNDEEQYSCSICKGFFQTKEHLDSHTMSVHGERDIECDICGERLRSSYALWSHKGKHLMKKDEYYSEEIVQKLQEEIAQRKARKKSMSSKEQSKKCEICGMVVLALRYKRHLEVHSTTKDWECEICHNFYKTRRYLIDHQKKTHRAEKVPCDICGLKFKGKTYLEIHKQTHGPKDKFCPTCGKGFTTLMYLKTHQLTHEEKKKFRCEQCMAAFSHKQRLAIHMVEAHGEGASRPCKYCGDLFPSRQKARRHERVVHEGFTMPTKLKKKPTYYNVVNIGDTENESLESKLVRLMPPGQNYVTLAPAVVKVPIPRNAQDTSLVVNDTITPPAVVEPDMEGQLIKLENGDEYQLMVEKDGTGESLEFVELTEEEQNVIIQEADSIITQTDPLIEENQSENVEQILEIPENAEQCQILLYPDGTFKLLNVVDKTNLQ